MAKYVEQQRNNFTYFALYNKLFKLILKEQFWEATVIFEAVHGLNPNWINIYQANLNIRMIHMIRDLGRIMSLKLCTLLTSTLV